MPKWSRVDVEAVLIGGVVGGIMGAVADSVDFHRGIATTIGVCFSVAVYSMWYGIRSK